MKAGENEEVSFERQSKEDDLDLNAPSIFNGEVDPNTKEYSFKKVTLPKKYYSTYDHFENFGMVCNELKQLYVALTRPRNRIIIYDDNIEKRSAIEYYWKQLSLVQVINKDTLEAAQSDKTGSNRDLVNKLLRLFMKWD